MNSYLLFQVSSYRTTVDDQNGDQLTFPAVWSKTGHNFITTMSGAEEYSSRSEFLKFWMYIAQTAVDYQNRM